MGAVSCPCRLARAISSPDVFCCRFSPSISGMTRRRTVSSVAISSSALSGSRPRLRSPVRPVPAPAVTDVVPELTDDQLESVNGGAVLGVSDGVTQTKAPKLSTSGLSMEAGGKGLNAY